MESEKISYSSSANLGPGYDILSLSHRAFFDRVKIETSNGNERIRIISEKTPLNPEKNTAGLSIMKIMDDKNINEKINIYIEKGVPIGLGLGSSGASSSAAVKAFNELFDLNLNKDEMIYYSMYGEIAAAGSAHPDNVSSGIYGGLTLITSSDPLRVKKIDINYDLKLLLIIPDVSMYNKTRYARSLVPKQIDIRDHVKNSGYLATLIYGFTSGDRDSIRYGMNDGIVEKARSAMFSYYYDIKEKAIKNNAISVCVSGAGPTILIFIDEYSNKNNILNDIKNIMYSFKTGYKIIETDIMEGYYD